MTSGTRSRISLPEVPEGAIPMTVPVYVRLRNALRVSDRLLERHDPEVGHGAAAQAAVLRPILERAHVLPIGDRVIVGSRVRVSYDEGEPVWYELVAPTEVDTDRGRISFESPIGAALLGARAGDEVTVVTPAGARRLQVQGVYH